MVEWKHINGAKLRQRTFWGGLALYWMFRNTKAMLGTGLAWLSWVLHAPSNVAFSCILIDARLVSLIYRLATA
eukprot:SAG31_NODE_6722_length_1910_cov_31.833241_1_plen_72_part_10